eukprot:5842924-Pleurochrysis_carterae.AAC.1
MATLWTAGPSDSHATCALRLGSDRASCCVRCHTPLSLRGRRCAFESSQAQATAGLARAQTAVRWSVESRPMVVTARGQAAEAAVAAAAAAAAMHQLPPHHRGC